MSEAEVGGNLLKVVKAEEAIYLELRSLLQQEQTCMARLDAAGLEEIVRAKQTLAEEARLLEESRLAVVEASAAALGLSEARPTLSQLCDRLGEAQELRESHSRLVALIGAVRELLDVNAGFGSRALAQVQATLELLGRLLPIEPTYGPQPAREGGVGRLVSRSV